MILEFIKKHTPQGKCPLGGNSVHVDKQFLKSYMPRIIHHLHYRIIDVSTVKELCRRWYPDLFKLYEKKECHRSVQDILESIRELHYYRQTFFKPTPQ
jgi:oligoribonuclease